MLETFYARLCELAENDGEICLLRAQWDFDFKLYENALSHVGRLYNHFSRHDGSHSRKLLVNMGKLLGNRLETLEATDIWLMLEAAFMHDLGMLVPYDLLKSGLESTEFRRHMEDIAANPRHELHAYVKSLKLDEPGTWLGGEHPLDAINHLHQLVVSWFRGRHGELSGDVALHPESVGILSPRNALVPDRLFRWLGTVSTMHTASFAQVMDLPEVENGMSDDICHPRFVACLLRLGDLLDLDNGRFCPVMARLYGPAPRSRKAHEDKHASIRHFVCTPDMIEIEAECESDEGYAETARWMTMLRQEIANQNARWNAIVPAGCPMRLPSVNRIDVRHKDNTLLEEGTLPRITLHEDKALLLLQGAGLYKNKWQAVRELLQNAVDATLIRIWVEHAKDITEQNIMPYSPKFREVAASYPIRVSVERLPAGAAGEATKPDIIRYKVSIQDQGCGISEATFKSMIQVASSSDAEKRDIIATMPEWMKPSGAFGLGLQSAFYLGADKLVFATRSLTDGTCAEIVLPAPHNVGTKYAKYLKLPFDCRRDIGSTLTFYLEQESIPHHLPGNWYFIGDFTSKFDPLFDRELPFIPSYLFYEIKKFAKNALVPLHMYVDDKLQFDSFEFYKEKIQTGQFFSANNIFLCLNFLENHRSLNIKYRGQDVEDTHLYFPFIDGDVDILSSSAEKMLTINRNKIRGDAENTLNDIIVSLIREYIKNILIKNMGKFSENEKMYASAAWEVLKEPSMDSINNILWKKILVDREKSMEQILNDEKNIYVNITYSDYGKIKKEKEPDDYVKFKTKEDIKITLENSDMEKLFFSELIYHGWFIIELLNTNHIQRYFCSKNDCFPYSYKAFYKHIKSTNRISSAVGIRRCMPVWGKYHHLTFVGPLWCSALSFVPGRKEMILPYKFFSTEEKIIEDDPDVLSEWCYCQQAHPGEVPLEEIRRLYGALQKELSALMGEDEELRGMLVRRPVPAESDDQPEA